MFNSLDQSINLDWLFTDWPTKVVTLEEKISKIIFKDFTIFVSLFLFKILIFIFTSLSESPKEEERHETIGEEAGYAGKSQGED